MDTQDLAKQVLKEFQTKKRDSGETFKSLKDTAPEWMQDLCQEAHGRMLPDDFRYEFIVEALEALSEYSDEYEAEDSLEASIYNSELTDWLASHLKRAEYVDQGVQEYGLDANSFDIFKALSVGQLTEKREVFNSVASSLASRLDEIGED